MLTESFDICGRRAVFTEIPALMISRPEYPRVDKESREDNDFKTKTVSWKCTDPLRQPKTKSKKRRKKPRQHRREPAPFPRNVKPVFAAVYGIVLLSLLGIDVIVT